MDDITLNHSTGYGTNRSTPYGTEAPAAASSPAPEPGLVEPIAGLLDGAHAELPTPELAALLLALEGPAERLAAEAEPDLDVEETPLALSPQAQERLWPIRQLLRIAAASEGDGGADARRRARLGEWLREYLDEVAARPRSAALVAA